MTPPVGADISKLRAGLDERVDGEVRFDAGTLSAYAQDASNYRQVPIGVVVPRTVDAAVAAVAVCRAAGAPVLSRGGGTSLAGQCVNTAIVIDWTKYCHRLVSFDKAARTATVQPGAALDKVNDALAPHGLMVGPKPSTHVSCTIGGMIGNNSCGSTAQAYGKMADSVRRLEILTYDGLRTWTGPTSDVEYEQILAAGGRKADIYRRLRAIRDNYLGLIRTRYPDIAEAADVVPLVTSHSPLACEGLDDVLISLEREEHLAGHFGHGCVHTRIPFELRTDEGIASYRSFAEDAADLVVSYGGSLSGEHGDGQSRGELLPKMFGPELIRAFGEMKDVFDPDDRMNPGKVVRPYRLDENLTLRGWFPREPQTFFGYPNDGGKFAQAASRCVGVGKCRGDEGGVMCPSYRVTREEEHSTRGRARLLMEMVRSEVITG